jgi:ABC-2 type transport system ATP-binding protein
MAHDPIIETYNLAKQYDDFIAVDDVNLQISEGEIFGLLGPNGAGKTTLILMLLGLTEPTSGSSKIFCLDPIKNTLQVKRFCGYLPEKLGFYENMTAVENLKFFSSLNNIPNNIAKDRINEALDLIGLDYKKDDKVNTFSKGMKQRLGLANVLVKKPKIAFMDEPTQGIDPAGIDELLDLFKRINEEMGITLVFSSHLLEQVQKICDNIGIMVKGKLVIRDRLDSIEKGLDETTLLRIKAKNVTKKIKEDLSNINGVKNIQYYDDDAIEIETTKEITDKVALKIINGGGFLKELSQNRTSLLDVYLKYVGEE